MDIDLRGGSMPTVTIKEASAGTAVGTNLTSGHRVQTSPMYRRVKRIGVVGSAAIGDASIDLYYGSTYMGTLFNTHAGANLMPLSDSDMLFVDQNTMLKPNEALHLLISDAGGTNVLVVTMEIEEIHPAQFRGRA